MNFTQLWHRAAMTSLGLFWTAFWAFGLGYLVSSLIQVFVTRKRMREAMGKAGPKSVALGSFFGFVSSSCSFAALSTTRSLFAKGAGLVPSLAFLLSSTNLVIELGIVIGVFLSWQFVVGEYLGAVLLILLMWLLVRLTRPAQLVKEARERASVGPDEKEQGSTDWKRRIRSREGWLQVANRYAMEWNMVWKDVCIGFTVAGIIATFVPASFFETLFLGAGTENPGPGDVVLQTLAGPVAAFFTFIGSMGNIPLAAVLLGNGVSFAGIMAFMFSDLVVFPVLRIQAEYYGWKMALYIMAVFLTVLVAAALIMHYGFAAVGMLPDGSTAKSVTDRAYFALDYTFVLNVLFAVMSVGFVGWKMRTTEAHHGGNSSLGDRILLALAMASFAWLGAGAVLPLV